jgi:hypothetical protein
MRTGEVYVATDDPAGGIHQMSVEVERSREASATLLDSFAQKLAAARDMPSAAGSTIRRAVRQRPGTAILMAAAAGFLIARFLRPKLDREIERA